MLPPTQIELISFAAGLRPLQCLLFTFAQQTSAKGSDNALRDRVLDGEYIFQRAIKALRPAMKPARDFDELHGDAQIVTRLAHTSFEQCLYIQLPADLFDVAAAAAELKCRGARDDTQSLDVGQSIDELFGYTFTQIILVALRAHVSERQNRDGRDSVLRF